MITFKGWTLLRPIETKRVAGELMLGQIAQKSMGGAGQQMLDLVKLNDALAHSLVSIECECEHDTMGELVLCGRCKAMLDVRSVMEEQGIGIGL